MSSRDAERRQAVVTGLTADFQAVFEASPAPLLVVAPPDWTIVAANDARFRMAGPTGQEQIGRRLYDAVPNNPNDPSGYSARNLTASFERVVATKSAEAMAVQRYTSKEVNGKLVESWVAPINAPVLGEDGEVELVIHHVVDVTEVVRLRTIEAAHRDREERYLALFNALDQGFCTIEVAFDEHDRPVDYRFLEISPSFERQTGIENCAGKWMREIAPDQDEFWFEIFGRVALTGEPARFEDHSTPFGLWWDVYAFRIRGERRVAVLFRDITNQKRAEAALRESEGRYRQIVQGAEDFAIVTLDSHGIITGWNSGAERITAYAVTEALGQQSAIIFTAEDRAGGAPEEELQRAQADGRAVNERWNITREGNRFWASGLTMLLDQEGGGYLKIFRDRTAEHEAEARRAALIDLSDALRDLQEPAEIALAAAEVLGRRLAVSRVGYAAVDDEAETLKVEREWTAPGVEPLAEVLSLQDYGSYVDDLKRGEYIVISDIRCDSRTSDPATASALEAKGACAFVNAPVIERGRLVAMLFLNHAEQRKWSAGEVALIREFAERTRTAVERARGEQALRNLNETLEAQVAARAAERDRLWNLSEDMLARADYAGMMSAVSPAWCRVLGWSEAELLSRSYPSLMHPDDVPPALEAIELMAETRRPARCECRFATRDGIWKPIGWTVAPEPDGVNFIAIGRDLSDAKAREAELEAAQDALRQSQKMEAMGSLTGGVAHDFNNLLTPIIGSLDMLVRKGIGSERERRLIDGALQSAERAKTLVQRLLAFARRQPLQPVAVDVGQLVGGLTELIGSTMGPMIDLRLDLAADLLPAKADHNQLEMALLNLAVNARDAMPDGGELTISAKHESVRTQHASDLQPGQYVRLSVRDSGSGMDEATRARAIEPFFSTKGVGKGTGLGLSMAHGLAAQLGGGLSIASAPNEGTTVDLWLPISEQSFSSEQREPASSGRLLGRGTVLLVDDEVLVRMSTADMLIDLGFEVIEAGSAEDALMLIESGAALDLLITDHLMPGMNGANLARAIRKMLPELPILIVSGYADVEGIAPDLPRLAKPFRNAELAASVSVLMPPASSILVSGS